MPSDSSISEMRQALAEAAGWCRMRTLTPEPPLTDGDRRQRARFAEASKLVADSYRRNHEADRGAREILAGIDRQCLTRLRGQLRTPSLKPSIDFHEKFEDQPQELAVEEVIARRSELLAPQLNREELSLPDETEGAILIYRTNQTVYDGASEVASEGYFDDHDAPPWDTWFHYGEGKLFSWVPSILMPLAQAGIDANPAHCIEWADGSVLKRLRSQ
jgi:hypothetical protein